jgi:hypothetical protein
MILVAALGWVSELCCLSDGGAVAVVVAAAAVDTAGLPQPRQQTETMSSYSLGAR